MLSNIDFLILKISFASPIKTLALVTKLVILISLTYIFENSTTIDYKNVFIYIYYILRLKWTI